MVEIAKLAEKHELEKTEMRAAYAEALIRTAETNPKVVTVDCDMASAMGSTAFAKRFGPARALNCGIQEANALGVAAGLSAVGFIPFYHTFSVYVSRRVYDQAFISCAYAGLNVKMIGGDAGVVAAANGGTHMPLDDVGVLRNIPGITIVEPCDTASFGQLIPQMADTYGVFYMRMARRLVARIYGEGNTFRIGKANLLRDGTDVTIITNGILVHQALMAADRLAGEGISARVADMFTTKPIDEQFIIESADKTGAMVTAENHSVINALGSAVAEVLARHRPTPMEMVGDQDEFGEVGTQEYLLERFGMTANDIYTKAKQVLQRKK